MTDQTPPASALDTDEDYRAAVIDLLGVLAYGELTAFERLAADAAMAPTIDDKADLAGMATAEYRHFVILRAADQLPDLTSGRRSTDAPQSSFPEREG